MRAQRMMVWVILAVAVSASAVLALGRDPFEGTWKVSIDPQDGNGKHFNDVLTFKGETLNSQELGKRGFAPARCEFDTRGRTAAQFTAESKSETDGTAKWTGMSTGQDINGTLVWTKSDGAVITYSFRGSRN